VGALLAPAVVRADGPAPFRVPPQDLVRIDRVVADAVAGSPKPLTDALRRDGFFTAEAARLDVNGAVAEAAAGRFRSRAFLARARPVVRDYVRANQADLVQRYKVKDLSTIELVLTTKLESLATYLELAQKARKGPTTAPASAAKPSPSTAVSSVFGRDSRVLGMAPAEAPHLVRGARKDLGSYGWVLAPKASASAAASARVETGRATYLGDVPLAGSTKLTTEVLLKGVGPTPYAGNVFNSKTTGAFSLDEGILDWNNSEILAKAGVPVYEPVALIGLPYWEFSSKLGFKPLGLYARLPQENLRVSDLGILSVGKRRLVADQLREKIALLAKVPAKSLSHADVIRFFAARMGRIAGLFEGGKTFGGQRYFHGMLHLQNVSLLGEIVDLGYNGGLVSSEQKLRAMYQESGYARTDRNWPAEIVGGASERAVLEYLVTAFREDLGASIPKADRPSESEIRAIFARAYQEGRSGKRASETGAVLRSARTGAARPTSPRQRLARASTKRPPAKRPRPVRKPQASRARSTPRRAAR